MLIDNSLVLKYNGSTNYLKKSNKEKGDDMNLYLLKSMEQIIVKLYIKIY